MIPLYIGTWMGILGEDTVKFRLLSILALNMCKEKLWTTFPMTADELLYGMMMPINFKLPALLICKPTATMTTQTHFMIRWIISHQNRHGQWTFLVDSANVEAIAYRLVNGTVIAVTDGSFKHELGTSGFTLIDEATGH
jgi:hypothetical protein